MMSPNIFSQERQERLAQYGFKCDCPACNELENDRRRIKIADWLDSLEGKLSSQCKKEDVRNKRAEKALALVEMVEQEGLMDYAARVYHLAAAFQGHSGKVDEADMWAKKEMELLRFTRMVQMKSFTGVKG
jgi:hypothetical protein